MEKMEKEKQNAKQIKQKHDTGKQNGKKLKYL